MPAKKPARKPANVVALSTFETEVDGDRVLVHAGDTVSSDSAVVKGREDLFVADSEYVQSAGTPPTP
jgi:hypothetical protein